MQQQTYNILLAMIAIIVPVLGVLNTRAQIAASRIRDQSDSHLDDASAAAALSEASKNIVDPLNQRIDELKLDLAAVRAELTLAVAKSTAQALEIAVLQGRIGDLTLQNAALRADKVALEQQTLNLRGQISDMRAQIDELYRTQHQTVERSSEVVLTQPKENSKSG
jgi:chromosome segregation ATPase